MLKVRRPATGAVVDVEAAEVDYDFGGVEPNEVCDLAAKLSDDRVEGERHGGLRLQFGGRNYARRGERSHAICPVAARRPADTHAMSVVFGTEVADLVAVASGAHAQRHSGDVWVIAQPPVAARLDVVRPVGFD
jgi:hypothetical protein